ncbi:hypothetical protein [uncultured Roseibium sp.]|uniref:c-type cytochrome n=1 Tax=uncultured Roseibium sp. TaxID=1936171 RepID=UPI0026264BD2|nr:hypothetical protein [uncultured Roseibium sp.]
MKRLLIIGLVTMLAAGFIIWSLKPADFETTSERFATLSTSIKSETDAGAVTFAFGDFGALSSQTLQTSGAPWKLLIAALVLKEANGDLAALKEVKIPELFRRFGFHSPDAIANWPLGLPEPDLSTPLGLNVGLAEHEYLPLAVTISNTGCAACHSSVVYKSDGTPDPTQAWLGMPNSSINLEAYATALFAAFKEYAGDDHKMMQAVQLLFPKTSWSERQTLRFALLPILSAEIEKRATGLGRLLPFSAGVPGATNGLDALKQRLGLINDEIAAPAGVYSSVPDLGGRLWRQSLLNTGTYIPNESFETTEMTLKDMVPEHLERLAPIVAYFTVPSMGVSEQVAEAHIDDARKILTWMMEYRPQPFPGKVNRTLLKRGQNIYRDQCADCHGHYDRNVTSPQLKSFPNWMGNIETDEARKNLTNGRVANAVNRGLFGHYFQARSASSYAAPPLTGLWASAPYLHNGSVPTLWHLMRPSKRPTRFVVGGHALDLEKVGLQGESKGGNSWMPPDSYTPWAITAEIDTREFGFSNAGHTIGFDQLTEEEKNALLEYLKLL